MTVWSFYSSYAAIQSVLKASTTCFMLRTHELYDKTSLFSIFQAYTHLPIVHLLDSYKHFRSTAQSGLMFATKSSPFTRCQVLVDDTFVTTPARNGAILDFSLVPLNVIVYMPGSKRMLLFPHFLSVPSPSLPLLPGLWSCCNLLPSPLADALTQVMPRDQSFSSWL